MSFEDLKGIAFTLKYKNINQDIRKGHEMVETVYLVMLINKI